MKVLLGVVVAIVASVPAFAFLLGHHYRQPIPAPAPELAVGAVAVVAVMATYVVARIAIRRLGARKAITS